MTQLLAHLIKNDQGQELTAYGLLLGNATVGARAANAALGPRAADYSLDTTALLLAAD